METRNQMRNILGAIAALATLSSGLAAGAVHAQTQGMERRGERQDTRQASRDVKQACKAGDEKSRAECRHGKHEVKQAGRHNETPAAPAQPAPHTNR